MSKRQEQARQQARQLLDKLHAHLVDVKEDACLLERAISLVERVSGASGGIPASTIRGTPVTDPMPTLRGERKVHSKGVKRQAVWPKGLTPKSAFHTIMMDFGKPITINQMARELHKIGVRTASKYGLRDLASNHFNRFSTKSAYKLYHHVGKGAYKLVGRRA